jgi:hypothetical protein
MNLFALILAATLASAAGGQQPATSKPDDQSRGSVSPAAAPPSTGAVDVEAAGISLDRIQRAVTRPPAIRLTETRPVFRVEVFGTRPTIEDILGPDYLKGPVPYSGMTHQEFLDMVTPEGVRGYSAFSNKQGMVVAATSIALKWALMQAIDKFKDAGNEREQRAAQREVDEALKALERARKAAGESDR